MLRPMCDADLRWYWGVGPSTWAGDAGLKSSFGAQLEAMASGVWFGQSTDIWAAEDAMIGRAHHAARATDIEARLRLLSRRDVRVLETHICGKGLTFSISSAAIFAPRARVMCKTERYPAPEQLRAALHKCKTANHDDVVVLVRETKVIVDAAVDKYELTVIKPARRLEIGTGHEVV